jgi:hypothetical protein
MLCSELEFDPMFAENKKKISAAGILTSNMVVINDHTIEWLDSRDFSLAALAKSIGIDSEHKAKAMITIEIVEEACVFCGNMTSGDKICQNCGKMVCDDCVRNEKLERLCPVCQVVKQTNQPADL